MLRGLLSLDSRLITTITWVLISHWITYL